MKLETLNLRKKKEKKFHPCEHNSFKCKWNKFSENNNNNNFLNIIIIIILIINNNNTWAYQDLQNNYLTFFNSAAATLQWKGHLCDMQESASIWKTSCVFCLPYMSRTFCQTWSILTVALQSAGFRLISRQQIIAWQLLWACTDNGVLRRQVMKSWMLNKASSHHKPAGLAPANWL
jgi:hypothetical protein